MPGSSGEIISPLGDFTHGAAHVTAYTAKPDDVLPGCSLPKLGDYTADVPIPDELFVPGFFCCFYLARTRPLAWLAD